MDGYLNDVGHPMVKVKVSGISRDLNIELEAMIDTGFSGFFLVSLVQALPMGLVLLSTANYSIADNSQMTTLLCGGEICTDDGACISGLISVTNQETDPLIGVDFLKKANVSLDFCPTSARVSLNPLTGEEK